MNIEMRVCVYWYEFFYSDYISQWKLRKHKMSQMMRTNLTRTSECHHRVKSNDNI